MARTVEYSMRQRNITVVGLEEVEDQLWWACVSFEKDGGNWRGTVYVCVGKRMDTSERCGCG